MPLPEKLGDLHGAIDDLISAKENSKIDSALFWSCLWHLGRIRIKAEKEEGIENIKVHLDKFNDWHWRANDLALLGIAQYDLKNNPKKAKIYFSLMFDEYPKRNGEIDVSKIKRHTYGTDNALANCRVALNRLKGISEDQTLCDKIQNFKLKLEKMRSQFLSESFSFLDLKT